MQLIALAGGEQSVRITDSINLGVSIMGIQKEESYSPSPEFVRQEEQRQWQQGQTPGTQSPPAKPDARSDAEQAYDRADRYERPRRGGR